MKIKELNNKKILLWGLGRETQACLEYLYPLINASWYIYSDNSLNLAEQNFLANFNTISLIKDIDQAINDYNFDVIIKSPGVSLYRPELQLAINKGIKLTSASNIWFAEKPAGQVIAVTGTKGKSTTSSLIYHLLKEQNQKVTLAGNIGRPLISLLNENIVSDYYVVELSSYQLTDLQGEIDLAVLLNLYPEHLDWHGSQKQYYTDKAKIIERLKLDGTLITSKQVQGLLVKKNFAKIIVFDDNEVSITGRVLAIKGQSTTLADTTLPGKHNLLNAAAAIRTVSLLGFKISNLLDNLSSFKPLPHRLEPVITINQVLYVNDSIATIPEASAAAVNSFTERKIILILGGLLRNQDWTERVAAICQPHVKTIICMGENAEHIISCLDKLKTNSSSNPPETFCVSTLEQAVLKASTLAESGELILLSPGSASYDQFKNFEERGEKFKDLVGKIKGK